MRLSVPAFLSVLITLGVKANSVIQPDCVTPVNSLGKCVASQYCVSVMTALINNDHLTNANVATFLRKAQCGIERGSHKVCCEIKDIDFGNITQSARTNPSAPQLPNILLPPHATPHTDKRLSDYDKCGKLEDNETPFKWIGELWFEEKGSGKTRLEMKCLGTLISRKHLIVPAHCVASLPENTSIDFVEIRGEEFAASKIFIHASYNKPKFANDIAIIELDTSDEEINDAVCLPGSQSDEHDLKPTIAVMKRAGGSLKLGTALFNSSSECSSYFNQQLTDLTPGQFCANVQSNETAYSPFVGAVAIQAGINRQYTLKGFTSTAVRSGQAFDESRPYIFTDIAYYTNWINSAIGDEMRGNANAALAVEPTSGLQPCQTSNSTGFCVKPHQCSLYTDSSNSLSDHQESYLDRNKCVTTFEISADVVSEDGICCESNFINNDRQAYDIDQRFQGKRGFDLLNMTKCGQVDPTRRIVGGTRADMNEFPWIGLVKYKIGRFFKYTCGSSLISDKYVLTCAHCITSLPFGYEIVAVRLGEYDRTTDPDCLLFDENQQECNPPVQDIPIENLIPHPNYNTPRYANDVGLIRLSRAPNMNRGIIPICLPINDEMLRTISDKYTVAGFGFTENGRDSDVLLKVALPKFSKETCQSLHSSMTQLTEGQECFGGEGIKDSCKGDSGNPLMNYVNVKGKVKAVQLGIVAAGHSLCGRGASGFPGIYSDVSYYMEWILDNMDE